MLPEGPAKLAPLHVAAGRGDVSALITLSKMDYDINEPEPITRGTPLHLAVNKGNYECVCCIIDYYGGKNGKLNINAQNKDGDTALHIASRAGNIEIVKVLCDANATILGILNHHRESILDLAKEHEIYQILMTAHQRMELENELINIKYQQECVLNIIPKYDSTGHKIILSESPIQNKIITSSKLADSYNSTDIALQNIRMERNNKRLNETILKNPTQKQSYTIGYIEIEPIKMIDSPTNKKH